MTALHLCAQQVKQVKDLAGDIAEDIHHYVQNHSTLSIERTVLRLFGVDGVDDRQIPLVNRVVDILAEKGLPQGVSRPFAAFMSASGRDARQTARMIEQRTLTWDDIKGMSSKKIADKEKELAGRALSHMDRLREKKADKIKHWGLPPQPWKYLIVATGNIHEDLIQARSAVNQGADIIAQIRSTAQSLLDYVPYGLTVEGFGGTYATQKNFNLMRRALDEASEQQQRYIRLVNYSSGLCMAEIAACAALENLDILLNDSMYGILFRDINMKRTFIDQYFSRLICSRAEIIINTGEDNYLTTSDGIEKAHTVTASQLINEAMAEKAGLTEDLLGLGHAFEIDPHVENAFLYELAHALLARNLFPRSPIKYMPPTRYKSTDIFYSHCLDTLYNLASVTTKQSIHLAGIPTEAVHNPFMQDRYLSLAGMAYVFHTAKNLGDEIMFKPDGFIAQRARTVLDETFRFLTRLRDIGLMSAIEAGEFAGIKRIPDGGKGYDGVFEKGPDYTNSLMEMMENNQ